VILIKIDKSNDKLTKKKGGQSSDRIKSSRDKKDSPRHNLESSDSKRGDKPKRPTKGPSEQNTSTPRDRSNHSNFKLDPAGKLTFFLFFIDRLFSFSFYYS
jgi:hypothetical protein